MSLLLRKYTLACFIAGMVIYTACDKEPSSEIYPPNSLSTCSDGILNQGEFKIDCGGPCDTCVLAPLMTAVIDSFWIPAPSRGPGFWQASNITATNFPDGLVITGTDASSRIIRFKHNQAYTIGVYTYQDIEGESFACNFTDGIVEFTAFDTIKKAVTGNFSFNCVNTTTGKKERVLNGKFEDIKYQ